MNPHIQPLAARQAGKAEENGNTCATYRPEQNPLARLVLADGSEFTGTGFGAACNVSGEVVFTTGMVGYPESLTDPSFRGQILVFTFPLIGNYGIPAEQSEKDLSSSFESDRIQVQGLVVSGYTGYFAHWNACRSLSDWLQSHGVPAITGIDTRALTKRLREHGSMTGKIVFAGKEHLPICDPKRRNLVAEVSISCPVVYAAGKRKVILVDCGSKNSIIRQFLQRGITIIRVPWDYDFTREPGDGIIISNGPGDPALCTATIKHVRSMLSRRMPILGICLGAQILALAAGGKTYKLKYGHRGQNQPSLEKGGKRCFITSQNHGYAVDAASLPDGWREWFVNLNDGSNEGFCHEEKPFFGVQFHPEASPGPEDIRFILDLYTDAVRS